MNPKYSFDTSNKIDQISQTFCPKKIKKCPKKNKTRTKYTDSRTKFCPKRQK